MKEENQIKNLDYILNCKRVLSEVYEELKYIKNENLAYDELIYMIEKTLENIEVNYINHK